MSNATAAGLSNTATGSNSFAFGLVSLDETVTPASPPAEAGLEAQPRKWRKLSRTEQLRLLREYEALPKGAKGLFLRQHGIDTAQISAWRSLRDEKFLNSASKRGRKAKEVNPLAKEVAEKDRLNRTLQTRVELLEKVIEIQKKVPR